MQCTMCYFQTPYIFYLEIYVNIDVRFPILFYSYSNDIITYQFKQYYCT